MLSLALPEDLSFAVDHHDSDVAFIVNGGATDDGESIFK